MTERVFWLLLLLLSIVVRFVHWLTLADPGLPRFHRDLFAVRWVEKPDSNLAEVWFECLLVELVRVLLVFLELSLVC